jgi:Fic family protein
MRLNVYCSADDEEISGELDFMDRRRYVIRAMVPPGYEAYFQDQARYTSAHSSTAIEGNPLGEEVAMQILAEGATADNPAAIEKLNLDQAYELMSLLSEDKSTKIDEGIIRTMNSLILKGLPEHEARNRGRYRPGQNQVVDTVTREVRYRPPPPEWVAELMAGFVEDVHHWMDQYPGPIAAALTHFGLTSIHPFDNGNGRTARLLADMVLDIKGWSIQGMLSISNVILDRRQEYYDTLRRAQTDDYVDNVDATPFIRFHTSALATAAAWLEERVVLFNKRRDTMMRRLDFLNPRQVTGLMFMLDIGPLSTSVYARLTQSSPATALADLTSLVNYSAAVREGAGRSTRYGLHPELRRAAMAVS